MENKYVYASVFSRPKSRPVRGASHLIGTEIMSMRAQATQPPPDHASRIETRPKTYFFPEYQIPDVEHVLSDQIKPEDSVSERQSSIYPVEPSCTLYKMTSLFCLTVLIMTSVFSLYLQGK